jgi:hypothetical protein
MGRAGQVVGALPQAAAQDTNVDDQALSTEPSLVPQKPLDPLLHKLHNIGHKQEEAEGLGY